MAVLAVAGIACFFYIKNKNKIDEARNNRRIEAGEIAGPPVDLNFLA